MTHSNVSGGDAYIPYLNFPETYFFVILFDFIDYTGTALDSDALLTTPPYPSAYDLVGLYAVNSVFGFL